MKNKDFKVKVETKFGKSGKVLKVTHNGRQWSTISLYGEDEIDAVIKVLENWKRSLGAKNLDNLSVNLMRGDSNDEGID